MKAIKLIDEFIKSVDTAIDEITEVQKMEQSNKADALAPDFKPNKNLGEGKASKRNLEYRQKLLTLLKDSVYTPVQKIIDSKKPVEEKISAIDSCIDDYIKEGSKLIETSLTQSYMTGSELATGNIKKEAKKRGINYSVKIEKTPKRLQQLINMQKRNLEDKALVLRGRLRSAVDTDAWMGTYGNNKA
jgi:hypothetical protein